MYIVELIGMRRSHGLRGTARSQELSVRYRSDAAGLSRDWRIGHTRGWLARRHVDLVALVHVVSSHGLVLDKLDRSSLALLLLVLNPATEEVVRKVNMG
jgi:hypothetical protein